jgi:peptidoglycan/xylan/chitin deacetylase (PgdA/CDA1 family)
MEIKNLVAALHDYERRKETLSPEKYIGLDIFRRHFPDLFPLEGPPGHEKATPEMMSAFGEFLRGGKPSDAGLRAAFGISDADWDAAWKAADPVRKPIPDKLVLMTFDDSTLDHYETACPLLEKHGGRAVLFTTEMEKGMFDAPGFWDKDVYMTWEQIRELSDRGHEIANHTLHHNILFPDADEDAIVAEVRGLEERCERHGVPKPNVIGYPVGACDPRSIGIARGLGYRWGRGSASSGSPYRLGGGHYEPHWDDPMIVPGVFARSPEMLKDAIDACTDGKVMLLVFHSVKDEIMMKFEHMTFGDMVNIIYDNGGQCVTFRDLEEYIDPDLAWDYIHP